MAVTLTAEQLAMLQEDADALPADASLSSISSLAKRQIELEGELDRLAALTKDVKGRLDAIRDLELPEAMADVGLSFFALDDGRVVRVKEELTASVPASRKGEIVKALRDMDAGYLIANTISVVVEKGHDNMASEFMEKAKELGFKPKRDEAVNTGSLKKFLREKLSGGEDIDLGFFGAHLVRRAKIEQ